MVFQRVSALVMLLLATLLPIGEAQAQRAGKAALVVKQVRVVNGKALKSFHRALGELQSGTRERVRVYHFGDSNVAADMWTGSVRRTLQERFGNGGPGYLLPYPHGSYHTGPTKLKAGPSFSTCRHGFAKAFGPVDGFWGLMGVAMEGQGPGAWFEARIPPLPGGATFEMHALGQNPGGQVTLAIDRTRPEKVDTFHPSKGLVRQMWPLTPGAHVIKGQVTSRHSVRLLGLVVESRQPGVVYDTLGINGHRVTAFNLWNIPLLASEFRQRPPDLVVLSYGGNEGLSRNLSLDQYEKGLRKALVSVRRLAPKASCLLVGPVAMCPERPKVTGVTDIQRRVGPEYGCGFWDTRQVSGGPGSLCQWIATDKSLVSRDRLHLRKKGYQIIAKEFSRAILRGYSPLGTKN